MKFPSFKKGQLSLVLTLSILVSGCNPEEYFPIEEFVQGEDAFCSQAQSSGPCHELADRCQAAYLDLEKDDQEPIFAACVANPEWVDPDAPSDPNESESIPTLEDAIHSKCADLENKYLFVVKLVSKKETKVVSKVKVCHSTDKGEHTIIIACPALKAHAKHHDGDDYLGVCK